MEGVGMAAEFLAAYAHNRHYMLDKYGKAGLFGGGSLDFRPDGRDVYIGGDAAEEAEVQKLEGGEAAGHT